MGSAYPEFKLLPPPPPTFLSASSPQRAQLPRFSTVDEATHFVRSQVFAEQSVAYVVTLWFVIFYIGLLVALAGSVIIRRILTGSFWIFRVIRRPDGLLIVPHLHCAWSSMAGMFGFISTVMNIGTLVRITHGQAPRHTCLLLIYQWSPLYLGVSFLGWASAVAGTQNLVVSIRLSPRLKWKVALAPWVANSIGIGLPVSCSIAVFFPSFIANIHSERARRLYEAWMKDFKHETQLSEAMLIGIQRIWFEMIDSSFYLAIAALLWSIFASITFIIYVFFSGRLLLTLQRHLRKRGGKTQPLQNVMTISMGLYNQQECDEDEAQSEPAHGTGDSTQEGDKSRERHADTTRASSEVGQERHDPKVVDFSKPKSKVELVQAEDTTPAPSRQPPLPFALPGNNKSEAPTAANSIERAVLYFFIQVASISLGLAIMDSTAMALAARFVASTETGDYNRMVTVCWSILEYVCVVFGTTTLCSIAHETFEESIAGLIHPTIPSQITSITRGMAPSPLKLKNMTISVLERRRRREQRGDIITDFSTQHNPDEVDLPTAHLPYGQDQHQSNSATTIQSEKALGA